MSLSYAPSLSESVAGASGPGGLRPQAAALRREDGAVIRPSTGLELSRTA